MSGNGRPSDPHKVEKLERDLIDADGSKAIARLDRELGNAPKLQLDPSQLTIRDLKRAKATVLGGKDPFEALNDPLDAAALTIWCLKSRENPALTLQQAEDTPLGEFEMATEEGPPPPTASPAEPGAKRGNAARKRSGLKRASATSTT